MQHDVCVRERESEAKVGATKTTFAEPDPTEPSRMRRLTSILLKCLSKL